MDPDSRGEPSTSSGEEPEQIDVPVWGKGRYRGVICAPMTLGCRILFLAAEYGFLYL
jgi:hypothetical protein